MDRNNQLDPIMSLGKLGVEASNLERSDKDYVKSIIDIVNEFSKLLSAQKEPSLSELGFDAETITRIKLVASQSEIDKVVVFPVIDNNGSCIGFVRVYGKGSDSDKILNVANCAPVTNISQRDIDILELYEKKYGIIIYERDHFRK